MARITRFLEDFQNGTDQGSRKNIATVAFLEDMYITNTGTVDAVVNALISAANQGDGYLIKNIKIPVGVTLDVLESKPIRLLNGKGQVQLVNWSDSNADIDVTYITS